MKVVAKTVAAPITWIYLGIVALLVIVDPQLVFEPPWLLPITNGLFISGAGLLIAVFAARSYLQTGSFSILMLGCGNLAFAAAAAVAGLVVGPYGPNANVTIYNCGALLGSLFHLIGAWNPNAPWTPLSGRSSRMRKLLFVYLFVLAVDFVVVLATVMNLMPVFFVQGEGPTWLRQLVLGSAVGGFAVASLLLSRQSSSKESSFHFWYARGLILIAAGLFAFFVQSLVGSPLGWSGRIGNYIGSIFLIASLLSIRNQAKESGVPLDTAVGQLFQRPKKLYQRLSIHSWLLMLALVVALPCFALLAWALAAQAEQARVQAYARVKVQADATAGRLGAILHDNETLMANLAARPLIKALDSKHCDSIFAEFVSLHPGFTTLALRDLQGNIVCSHLPNPVARYAPEAFPWYYEGLNSGKFSVSNAVLGPVSRRWASAMMYPVQDAQGKPSGALVMGLDLLKLNQRVLGAVPVNAVVAVQDSQGIFLLRSIDPEKWIGKRPVRPSGTVDLSERFRTTGSFTATSIDGTERVYTVMKLPGTGWHIAAGLRADEVFAPARAEIMRSLAIGGVVFLVVIALAWRLAQRIAWPIRDFAITAANVARGQANIRARVAGPAEVVELTQAFNDMLDARNEAESQLRLLETSVAQLNDAVIITDVAPPTAPGPRIVFVNQAAERLTGYARAELIGQTPRLFQGPRTDQAELRRISAALRQVRPVFAELINYTKAGTEYWIELNITPVQTAAGEATHFVAIERDITGRKQGEAEIHRLNAELEQRVRDRTAELQAVNQELEAFSYSVSHDLRAPLRHLTGFAELLQKNARANLDDQARRHLTFISESAVRMGQLIDDLLAFSRSGRAEVYQAPVNLDALVQQVIQSLHPDTQGRRIVWQIAPLPTVNADANLLRAALTNLFSNALKFTRSRDEATIQMGCTENEHEHIFFIRDNGVGFDMQYVEKLFDVFQRLHSTEEFEGTGIGLANVRRIISRHGGRTWAESVLGEGATFYFSLPK